MCILPTTSISPNKQIKNMRTNKVFDRLEIMLCRLGYNWLFQYRKDNTISEMESSIAIHFDSLLMWAVHAEMALWNVYSTPFLNVHRLFHEVRSNSNAKSEFTSDQLKYQPAKHTQFYGKSHTFQVILIFNRKFSDCSNKCSKLQSELRIRVNQLFEICRYFIIL